MYASMDASKTGEATPLTHKRGSSDTTNTRSRWAMVASGAACLALAGCVGTYAYLKSGATDGVQVNGVPTEGVPFQLSSSDTGNQELLDQDHWATPEDDAEDDDSDDSSLWADIDDARYFASGSVMLKADRADVDQTVRDALAERITRVLPGEASESSIEIGFVHGDSVLDRFARMDTKDPLAPDWSTTNEQVEYLTPAMPMRAYFSPFRSVSEEASNGQTSVAFTVEFSDLPSAEAARQALIGLDVEHLGALEVTSTDVHPRVMDEEGGVVTTCAEEAETFTADALAEWEDDEDDGEDSSQGPMQPFIDPSEEVEDDDELDGELDDEDTDEARDLITGSLGKYYGRQTCASTEYTGCSTESCMHGKCKDWPQNYVKHFAAKGIDLDNNYCRDIGGWGRTACFTVSGNIGMCAVNNCDKKETDRSCKATKGKKGKGKKTKKTKKNKKPAKVRYTKKKAAKAWLEAHNTFRCMHGVPMLKWNNNLAKHSMDWGIEAKAQMKHSTQDARSGKTLKKEYKKDKVIKKFSYAGENLCWGSPRPQGPAKCTKAWYDEIKYAPGNGPGPMTGQKTMTGNKAVPRGVFPPQFTAWGTPKVKQYGTVQEPWRGCSVKTTGHYTQVIWKDATHVGCATYKGLDVCQYGSTKGTAGNMGGRYKQNVKPLKKKSKKCRKRTKNTPKSDLPK